MEALYGYMTESELDYAITEKEHDVEIKRLLLRSEYIVESGKDSNKKNIIFRIFESIQKFIKNIVEKIGNFIIETSSSLYNKLDNAILNFDEDPGKKYKEICKDLDESARNIKNPKNAKKLTKKKVFIGIGAVTIAASVAFALYKKIGAEFKKRDKQIDDLKKDINDLIDKADQGLAKGTENSEEIEVMKSNIKNMDDSLKDLSKLSSDIMSKLNSASSQSSGNQPSTNQSSGKGDSIDDIIEKLKADESTLYNTNKTKLDTFFSKLKQSNKSHMKSGKYEQLLYSDVLDAFKMLTDPNKHVGYATAISQLNFKYKKK